MSNAPDRRQTDEQQNTLALGELLLRRMAARDWRERSALDAQIRRFRMYHMPVGGSPQDLLR